MFTLEIETENAAFKDNLPSYEIARILRVLATRIEGSITVDGDLHDVNGNLVGKWTTRGEPK